MPMNRKLYPVDWEEFSRRIRSERAGNKCEWCGAPNGEWICRKRTDPSIWTLADELLSESDVEDWHVAVKVVLTVAHLWQKECTCHPRKCAIDSHVAALCQRCHLLYDKEHHAANRARTLRQRKIDAGQQPLL